MPPRFPEPGELFERQYLIEAQAGRGGFARIYRAVQQQLEREVALKILKPQPHEGLDAHNRDAFESEVVQRFHREARNVAQLRDAHTITLYDYGRTSDGLFFMVFEFVDGKTLKFAATRNQPIDQQRVVGILQKVLTSLEEAHKLGMLHRDVKPANIMLYDYLGRTDQVKVLDFGISKAVLHNASVTLQNLTQEHVMMGTPRYMSPEQLRGDRIGPPSDLYSLGLVTYELLVGRQAIPDEKEVDIINRQISPEPLTLPDDVAVTDTLRATLHRMLAKDQQDRFQSTDELREALAAWDTHRGFPWESEWLKPSFEPAAREESTNVDQMVAPIDGEGTHEPLPTRQDEFDGPHRPVPTRRDEGVSSQPVDQEDADSTIGNVSALLIGVVSTLSVVGVGWVFVFPSERREPVDLAKTSGAPNDVRQRQTEGARPDDPLTVRTDPPGAEVRIDGRIVGDSPVDLSQDDLEYPLIVHVEHDNGTRLAQKVPSPTDEISLDFSAVGANADRADTDATTGTESEPDNDDSPTDDEASSKADDRPEPSPSESIDGDDGDDDGPAVVPLDDDESDTDPEPDGDEGAGGDEQTDDDSESGPAEHEFPPLDQ